MKLLIRTLIRSYQKLLRPWLPSACRFHPTCSEYMLQAVEKHGPLKGLWLGTKRLLRCHPWRAGGEDRVP